MKEVEHGRMRLDAPVNLYLPEPLQVRDQGYARPVQLRDLMTHSAGFEDKTLGRLFEFKPSRVRPLATYSAGAGAAQAGAGSAGGAAGIRPNYGAKALAGDGVSPGWPGKPYIDLAEAEIIGPLGLSHTTFREPYPADPDLPAPMPQALAADASAQGIRPGTRARTMTPGPTNTSASWRRPFRPRPPPATWRA